MIKFRQKNYTIPEGHYTGPKDMDKLPGTIEVIGKSALGGSIIGGIVGKIDKDSTVLEGAKKGAGIGTLAGIGLKILTNYIHKPMSKVKFQDVDKVIRREFGIYRAASLTVGDSVSNRASFDEKFSINDRNVSNYKLIFCIQNNKVTMYTFGMTSDEIDKCSKILDYYCKKYFGMEYHSSLLNQKVNAYSVDITFTNIQVISNFIMEMSNELQTKIDLLDSNAIVGSRLKEASESNEDTDTEGETRNFSVAAINKYDLFKILGKSLAFPSNLRYNKGFKESLSLSLLGLLVNSAAKLRTDELTMSNIPMPRENFSNVYLEQTLKKLHYIERFNYTIGDEKSEANMSMINGLFIVTVNKGNASKEIDKKYWESLKTKINRSEDGKVVVYTYSIQSRQEFEFLLKKLMSTKITFNIYEK
jgi:hypothetical protein